MSLLIQINFLMVGHTHEDIDGLFGVLAHKLQDQNAFTTQDMNALFAQAGKSTSDPIWGVRAGVGIDNSFLPDDSQESRLWTCTADWRAWMQVTSVYMFMYKYVTDSMPFNINFVLGGVSFRFPVNSLCTVVESCTSASTSCSSEQPGHSRIRPETMSTGLCIDDMVCGMCGIACMSSSASARHTSHR